MYKKSLKSLINDWKQIDLSESIFFNFKKYINRGFKNNLIFYKFNIWGLSKVQFFELF